MKRQDDVEQSSAQKDAPARAVPVGGAGEAALHFPKEKLDCARCEQRLVLGIFFDGTGHSAWADPDAMGGLTIHHKVHWCEHFIAMHENRASFPVDRATGFGGKATNDDHMHWEQRA